MSVTRNGSWAARVAIVGMAALAAAFAVTASAAAPEAAAPAGFDGGFISAADHPSFVANDHSVYAVRVVAHGLSPATVYHLRISFAVASGSAAADADRGFTWNPSLQHWVAVDESDWAELPAITTDETGSYAPGEGAGWFFVRFGDTRVTGTRFLTASLSALGGAEALRGASQPAVSVFDPRTEGFWVHNRGIVPAQDGAVQGAAQRVEMVAGLPAVDRLAIQRTEPNLCDDDGDGIVDNEGRLFYANGDTDITGDYRMALPLGVPSWYLYEGSPPPPEASFGQGFTNLLPDTDLALDAVGDTVPPSAPDGLAAKATTGRITLTWDAAGDATVGSYLVYRWTDGASTDPFTPVKTVVARTAGSTLTYADTDVTAGAVYHYEVRAEDSQTSVGPRSNEATAAPPVPPILEATTLTLGTVPARLACGAPVVLTATLRGAAGQPLSGQAVRVACWRVTEPAEWTDVGLAAASATPGAYTFVARPTVRTYYRFSLAATGAYAGALRTTCLLPRLKELGTPACPSRVSRGSYVTVSGLVRPHLPKGARTIRIQCFFKAGSKRVLKRTVDARSNANASSTRYRVRIRFSASGAWELRALYPGSGPLSPFARQSSGYRAVRVTR
jgi:hypothetical protein